MAQNKVLKVLRKINCCNFSDYLQEVTATQSLKLTEVFFGERSLFEIFESKGGQRGAKMWFYQFFKNYYR